MCPFRSAAVGVIALLSCAGLACSYQPQGLPASSARSGAARAAGMGAGVFGAPLVLPGWDVVFVPYSVVQRDAGKHSGASLFSGFSSSGSYSGSGASYSVSDGGAYHRASAARWNNLLLYDPRTGDARLLLDERAVIVRAFFPKARPGPEQPQTPVPQQQQPPPRHVLLACAKADTNGDRVINADDAAVLYHVNLARAAFTAITPDGARFEQLDVDDGGRVLYVRSVTDADGDRAFTAADEAIVARVDLTSPSLGTPIVPDELRRRAFSIVAGEGN